MAVEILDVATAAASVLFNITVFVKVHRKAYLYYIHWSTLHSFYVRECCCRVILDYIYHNSNLQSVAE